MIAMPQWTDQTTNAKLIEDIWKIGLRVSPDDKGVFREEALKKAIKEIMDTEIGKEIKGKAIQWKNLAAKTVDEGGSSNMNIRVHGWLGSFIMNQVRMWCNYSFDNFCIIS